jgi:phage terminase large subunit-like protein
MNLIRVKEVSASRGKAMRAEPMLDERAECSIAMASFSSKSR